MTPREEPPPSELTSVVLDIGGGFGALVVNAAARDAERQVDIVDNRGQRYHAVVHGVMTAGGSSHQAVFASLPAGSYQLVDPAGTWIRSFEVKDGCVTDVPLYSWQDAFGPIPSLVSRL
jgi:hypothetical protein